MHAPHPVLHLPRRLGVRLREERGVALVEFAVILPVLLMIVLGIIYFGRYEDYANQETQLAEQGVRWAALNQNPGSGSLQAYIQSQAQPELRGGSSDVTSPAAVWIYTPASCTTNCYAVGNPIRVCVVATVLFPSPIGAPSVTMAQTATMRIEVASTTTTYTGTTTPYTSTNPTGTMPSQCTA